MKLLVRTENKVIKDKNCVNAPHLEITDVVLVHCNIANTDYQLDSKKINGKVLDIPRYFTSLNTFSLEFSCLLIMVY